MLRWLSRLLLLLLAAAAPSASSAAPPLPPSLPSFTVCTTVMNELAYMPEWIEFHALQGASKFVVGDHRSSDGLRSLVDLYARRPGFPTVEVHANQGWQKPFLQWCGKRERKAAWILFADNDEFFWSPAHGRVASYLAQQPKEVTQVFTFGVRFGLGVCRTRHRVGVEGGTLCLVAPPHPRGSRNSTPPWPLVVETHTRRAPSAALGEGALLARIRASGLVPACNATFLAALPQPSGESFCGDGDLVTGKSFVRGDAFAYFTAGNPHYAQLRRGLTHREVNLTQLRFNHVRTGRRRGAVGPPVPGGLGQIDHMRRPHHHTPARSRFFFLSPAHARTRQYWVRCRQDAYIKAEQWQKRDPVEWAEHAALLRQAVPDTGLLHLVEPVKQRLRELMAGPGAG